MSRSGFPQLRVLIERIGRVITGRAAATIDPAEFEAGGTIVALPVWAELKPAIDVGQKAVKNADLMLPARIEWSVPVVLVLGDDDKVDAQWRITNMGHRLSGSVTVTRKGLSEEVPGQLPTQLVDAYSSGDLRRKLKRLTVDGETARWETLQSFEGYTRTKIVEASRILAQEFSEYHGRPINGVMDDIAIDDLLAHMLFGSGDTSIVSRMVDRALDPAAFNRFDPARYFSLNLKSRALGEVRRSIGDPHIGTKIRRLYRLLEPDSLDELVSAYNAQYPNEHLGLKRAAAALTAGPELAMTSVSLVSEDDLRHYAGRRRVGSAA